MSVFFNVIVGLISVLSSITEWLTEKAKKRDKEKFREFQERRARMNKKRPEGNRDGDEQLWDVNLKKSNEKTLDEAVTLLTEGDDCMRFILVPCNNSFILIHYNHYKYKEMTTSRSIYTLSVDNFANEFQQIIHTEILKK